MTIKELCEKLGMKVLSGEAFIQRQIKGVYCCDLLSWVMSHAKKHDAWITIHTNVNVPAVAVMADVSCVIIPENIEVEKNTIEKAEKNEVVILSTDLPAAEASRHILELLDKQGN